MRTKLLGPSRLSNLCNLCRAPTEAAQIMGCTCSAMSLPIRLRISGSSKSSSRVGAYSDLQSPKSSFLLALPAEKSRSGCVGIVARLSLPPNATILIAGCSFSRSKIRSGTRNGTRLPWPRWRRRLGDRRQLSGAPCHFLPKICHSWPAPWLERAPPSRLR